MAMAPTPQAPTPASTAPSGWWYLGTIGISAFALAVAIGLLVHGVHLGRAVSGNATRVDPGTSSTVTFIDPGSFTLYYVGPPQVNGAPDVADFVARVHPILRPDDGGPTIVLRPYKATSSVEFDRVQDRQQVALGTFRITRPGDYTLTSNQIAGVGQYEDQLLVTPSPLRPVGHWALIGLGVLLAGIAASVISSAALARTRGRAMARQRTGGPPGGGWPPSAPSPAPAGTAGWPAGRPLIPPPPPGYGSR